MAVEPLAYVLVEPRRLALTGAGDSGVVRVRGFDPAGFDVDVRAVLAGDQRFRAVVPGAEDRLVAVEPVGDGWRITALADTGATRLLVTVGESTVEIAVGIGARTVRLAGPQSRWRLRTARATGQLAGPETGAAGLAAAGRGEPVPSSASTTTPPVEAAPVRSIADSGEPVPLSADTAALPVEAVPDRADGAAGRGEPMPPSSGMTGQPDEAMPNRADRVAVPAHPSDLPEDPAPLTVDYDFTGSTATRAVYLDLAEPVPVPGRPIRLVVTIDADGQGAWPSLDCRDAEGTHIVLRGEHLDDRGWRRYSMPVPPATVHPLCLHGFYLAETRPDQRYRGRIGLGAITAEVPIEPTPASLAPAEASAAIGSSPAPAAGGTAPAGTDSGLTPAPTAALGSALTSASAPASVNPTESSAGVGSDPASAPTADLDPASATPAEPSTGGGSGPALVSALDQDSDAAPAPVSALTSAAAPVARGTTLAPAVLSGGPLPFPVWFPPLAGAGSPVLSDRPLFTGNRPTQADREADLGPLFTADLGDRSWRFAVVSDTQFIAADPPDRLVAVARDLLRDVAASGVDLVIVAGDFTDAGSPADLALARRILAEELADGPPWHYVPGNHEIAGGDIATFSRHFGPARQVFDHRGVRFVTIDTSNLRVGAEQFAWLRGELARAARDKTVAAVVVVGHVPPHDPTGHEASRLVDRAEAAELEAALADFAATGKGCAYVAGHAGVFATWLRDGVAYLVNGNSGKDPAAPPHRGGVLGWSECGVGPLSSGRNPAELWRRAPDWLAVRVRRS